MWFLVCGGFTEPLVLPPKSGYVSGYGPRIGPRKSGYGSWTVPGRPTMLTDSQCRSAKSKDRPYKLTDGNGLYLEVKPNGVKAWRYRFKLTKGGETKENLFAIGDYSPAPPSESSSSREPTPPTIANSAASSASRRPPPPLRRSPANGWPCATGRKSPRRGAWTCCSGSSSRRSAYCRPSR